MEYFGDIDIFVLKASKLTIPTNLASLTSYTKPAL